LGHCTKVQAHIQLIQNAIPKFFKPRPLPFAYLDSVKEEIQRNVERGIMERIDTSPWAAPIVPIRKPTGKIRICGDFKVTINSQILVDQHPIPSIDELLTRLNNGEKFTKLDLTDAYLQVELDEPSKQLVVINTPLGLFRYNRMPFGVANAPAIFQRIMDQVLAGITNSIAYLDDILITGQNEEDHFKTLDIVLSKLAEFGLRCNRDKCSFFKDEVLYLGYVVNRSGKQPDPARVEAIQKLPVPTDVKQIEAFIGKINYYGKFIPKFSDHCVLLNRLRQNNVKWNWDSSCQKSFDTLKKLLSDATMLVHFDSKLPIILATDASSYGIGAVIMHRYADGTEKPIAHASKTLTPTEKKYSQIEKEALSIIYGIKKFHQYLAGHTFELVTDHQPLLTIFNPGKGIPITTANRLQRWAISLMGYSYNIRYKPTRQHGNADGLSRLPSGNDDSFIDDESIQVNCIQAQIMEEGPVDCTEVRAAMEADKNLSLVQKFTLSEWPNSLSRKNNPDIFQYYGIRKFLSVVNGCLLKDAQVVIPKPLRYRVLQMIHREHLGVVKMKQLARMHCWWPKMEIDIENLAKSCHVCASLATAPKEDFKPWPEPEHVWSRVHMDFLGPVWSSKWLIVIDAKSKFPFVADMGNDTSAKNVCNVLEQAIDWLGPPTTLVSDNGPPFTSFEMGEFYKKYGIEHLTTAPYHPPSNGIAERFVRSFKEGMLKQQQSGQTNKLVALRNVLRNYRWTPHTTTGTPPAEALFRRPIRTELARLKPSSTKFKTKNQKYNIGQMIWMRHHQRNKRLEWKSGVVKRNIGSMMYEIMLTDGQKHIRHQNQLRPRQEPDNTLNDLECLPDDLLSGNKSSIQLEIPAQQTPRYPSRHRKPPDRYTPT
jgi:transposase InsO family protein